MNRKKTHIIFVNFDANLFDKKSVFSFLSLFEFEEQIFFSKKRFCKSTQLLMWFSLEKIQMTIHGTY